MRETATISSSTSSMTGKFSELRRNVWSPYLRLLMVVHSTPNGCPSGEEAVPPKLNGHRTPQSSQATRCRQGAFCETCMLGLPSACLPSDNSSKHLRTCCYLSAPANCSIQSRFAPACAQHASGASDLRARAENPIDMPCRSVIPAVQSL